MILMTIVEIHMFDLVDFLYLSKDLCMLEGSNSVLLYLIPFWLWFINIT